MVTKIIALLTAFFETLGWIRSVITKTPTQKIEEDKKDLDQAEEKQKKTGRPTWTKD